MTIDSLYNEMDKNNFYIGRISQVYRDNSVAQVENLSLLYHVQKQHMINIRRSPNA